MFARTTDNQLATLDVANQKAGHPDGTGGSRAGNRRREHDRVVGAAESADAARPGGPGLATGAAADRRPAAGRPGSRPGEPRLVVARGGTAVIARVEAPPSPFGGPDTLYAVRGPVAPAPLGQADANSPVTVARLSPDGASLAYALYRSTDSGCGTAALVMSDAAGAQQTFDVAGPDAGHRVEGAQAVVARDRPAAAEPGHLAV